MSHPARERLDDYAWDLLEGADAREIEAHLAACAECARHCERARIEARRIAEALEPAVPAGLAARILDAQRPAAAARRPFLPAAAAAAAVLCAALAGWAWRESASARARVRELESEIARAPRPGPELPPAAEDSFLDHLILAEMEGNLPEIVAAADLTAEEGDAVRRILLAATETTGDAVGHVAGEGDLEALLATDTLAGLDTDLAAALDAPKYQAVSERLQRASRDAAQGAARALVSDLQKTAALDAAQAAALEALLVDRCAWRRDLPFFPELAREALVARHVASKNGLEKDVRALLNDRQAVQVAAYMTRAGEARKRMWSEMRRKS